MTTLGKYRHLSQCSTIDGQFVILAIDHRDNLLETLNQYAPEPLDNDQFAEFKQHVMSHLLPYSSAVLTDPEYGFGPGISSGIIDGHIGILSPLELTNYHVHPSQNVTMLMPGWSVGKIKRVGGAGVKMLLYYHPAADDAGEKQDIVRGIVKECIQHDIPLFLEPLAYSLNVDQPLENAELLEVAVESARTFSAMGVDVLKLQFPVDVKQEKNEDVWVYALEKLDRACTVPWALLSAGVTYDVFRRQTELACQAGACGVIAGRALWSEAVKLQGRDRDTFLYDVARLRMEELGQICAEKGASWKNRVVAPKVAPGWYERYGSDNVAGAGK
jgi:tagatose 1,6-diphosphate aldolase